MLWRYVSIFPISKLFSEFFNKNFVFLSKKKKHSSDNLRFEYAGEMNNSLYFYSKKINDDKSTVCISLFIWINLISDIHLLQSEISSNISRIWHD